MSAASSIPYKPKNILMELALKHLHKWQEFKIESWDHQHMQSIPAIVSACAFTTLQSAEAHHILFRHIFEIAQQDTNLLVKFHHIHGCGIKVVIADGHKGQGLVHFLRNLIPVRNMVPADVYRAMLSLSLFEAQPNINRTLETIQNGGHKAKVSIHETGLQHTHIKSSNQYLDKQWGPNTDDSGQPPHATVKHRTVSTHSLSDKAYAPHINHSTPIHHPVPDTLPILTYNHLQHALATNQCGIPPLYMEPPPILHTLHQFQAYHCSTYNSLAVSSPPDQHTITLNEVPISHYSSLAGTLGGMGEEMEYNNGNIEGPESGSIKGRAVAIRDDGQQEWYNKEQ
ncbi:hypothetical protein J3A83DRAFT_4188548 [Scleroderma citrinum]